MIYLIIFVTVAVSLMCFSDRKLMGRLALRPYQIVRNNQWDRLLTHGFVHGDYTHLLINMVVFWSFGLAVHRLFTLQAQAGMSSINPNFKFLLLYLGGMIAASIYDVFRYRKDPFYSSIGASGAVAAVIFTSVFYNPLGMVYFFGLIPIPGIIFGVLYIGFEWYSARKQKDRINHHAHIFGSVYGFLFPLLSGGLSQINYFINGFSL